MARPKDAVPFSSSSSATPAMLESLRTASESLIGRPPPELVPRWRRQRSLSLRIASIWWLLATSRPDKMSARQEVWRRAPGRRGRWEPQSPHLTAGRPPPLTRRGGARSLPPQGAGRYRGGTPAPAPQPPPSPARSSPARRPRPAAGRGPVPSAGQRPARPWSSAAPCCKAGPREGCSPLARGAFSIASTAISP